MLNLIIQISGKKKGILDLILDAYLEIEYKVSLISFNERNNNYLKNRAHKNQHNSL